MIYIQQMDVKLVEELACAMDNVLYLENKLTELSSKHGCETPLITLLEQIEKVDESIYKNIVMQLERTTINLIHQSTQEFQTKLKKRLDKFHTIQDDYVCTTSRNREIKNYTWIGEHTWGFSFGHYIYAAPKNVSQWRPNCVRVPTFHSQQEVDDMLEIYLHHMNAYKGRKRQPIFKFNGLDHFQFEDNKYYDLKFENLELQEVKRRIIVEECTCRVGDTKIKDQEIILTDSDSDSDDDGDSVSESDSVSDIPTWLFSQ